MAEAGLRQGRTITAALAITAAHDLGIPADKLNVNGGATGLGPPIGAWGARIMGAFLGALEQCALRRGVAGACIGGSEATTIAN